MPNLRKSIIAIPILLFILACQAISSPVQQVQEIATQAGELVTQASGLSTEISPFETSIPDGSAIPNIPGNIFDPQSPPLSEWKGIPVMPQASAGEESEGMYIYKIAAALQEIQDYYSAQLLSLGWESSFSMPLEGTAILLYTKGNQVLSITIMPTEGSDTIVMINLQ
jgi:hypothetical protein